MNKYNKPPVIIIKVANSIIKPDGNFVMKSTPFILYIPTTNVRGNRIAAKIVNVLIVSFT